MMTTATLTKLNKLSSMLAANAVFCQKSDVQASKKTALFDILKYAIRKEAAMIGAFWGINATNVAKTPRQLNYVASETEHKLRKLFRGNEELKAIWIPQK